MRHFEEDHQMFYCPQDGYWNGTLIRTRIVDDVEQVDSKSEIYEMKIYNRYETLQFNGIAFYKSKKKKKDKSKARSFSTRHLIRIQNLITSFRNEFGRLVSIEPLSCTNRLYLELELRHQFRDEHNALDELARHIKFETNKVNEHYNKFIDSQHRTDAIWSALINKSN